MNNKRSNYISKGSDNRGPSLESSYTQFTWCEAEASTIANASVQSDFSDNRCFTRCKNLFSIDEVTSISVHSGLMSIDTSCQGCSGTYSSYEDLGLDQTCQALNMAQGESKLINQLCNCSLHGKHWCFVHNKVLLANDPQMGTVNDFGFMSDTLLYTPLYLSQT